MRMMKMKMMIRMMKLGIYGSSHNSEDSCFAQYHKSFRILAEIMETSGITHGARSIAVWASQYAPRSPSQLGFPFTLLVGITPQAQWRSACIPGSVTKVNWEDLLHVGAPCTHGITLYTHVHLGSSEHHTASKGNSLST